MRDIFSFSSQKTGKENDIIHFCMADTRALRY